MASINSKVKFEVNIQMTLSKSEAEHLLYFLKNGVTPVSGLQTPVTDIVNQFGMALQSTLE